MKMERRNHNLNLLGPPMKQLLQEKDKEIEELKSSLKKVHEGIKFGKMYLI